jgi:alanyl-tRNA synthetase
MTMAEAIKAGADAFFDEKYGEQVRVMFVDGYSRELCGGTHCRATGQIGAFAITGERSIGAGMRRIEALTGDAADALLDERLALLEQAAAEVGARDVTALPERLADLQQRLREAERRLREGGAGGGRERPADLARAAQEIGGVRLVTGVVALPSMKELQSLAREVRAELRSGVIALGLEGEEPQLFVTVSDDLVERGVSAAELVTAAAAAIDGRGGGRPQMAQGRGTRADGLARALDLVADRLRLTLSGTG